MWRYAPLYAAIRLADVMGRRFVGHWPQRERTSNEEPGLSIIIGERGTPDRLHHTLTALEAACASLDEPVQIIVIVNGADQADYLALQGRFSQATWRFTVKPLGYNGAIRTGLKLARYEWSYLLNSDMELAPDALRNILPYRRPEVFAVASQIFFVDQQRRREETGWTDFHPRVDLPEIYDRLPESGELIRAHVYAGGGSSLYRTLQLRAYIKAARDYSPFYWEDAEWGTRAWADGWQVLFCPTSHAHHHHRSTIGKYYDLAEVERIIHRNAVLFDLRNAWSGQPPGLQMHRVAAMPRTSRRELTGLGLAWRAMLARIATHRARERGLGYQRLCVDEWHGTARDVGNTQRPRLLIVSPFAVFPPAHGGARRIAELIEGVSDRFDVILLSDERSTYTHQSEAWFSRLYAVHLIEGRGDAEGEAQMSWIERMKRHAWPGLRAQLRRLIALYSPDIVQIEFMELALLVEERDELSRWVLTMHDVVQGGAAADEKLRQVLKHYDQVITCSEEDSHLLKPLEAALIPNGAIDRRRTSGPSSAAAHLLFMGPFRYQPNYLGILAFLDLCWPELRRRFPELRLTILSANGAADEATDSRLLLEGVSVFGQYEDPSHWLEQCTLTLNPLTGIHGSSIKLVESLLARRICVTTQDGARGFLSSDLEGMVICHDIASMIEPIAALLSDPAERHRRETASAARLNQFTWKSIAGRLENLYRELMER
ncbi:glycosyltransferase [Dyella sp. Tek66A03]|uniref:glycosyltransferase n=1 Tax=Dyella sp. Tek66A03 TaxID=3458298 RepID=UPI00403E9FFB